MVGHVELIFGSMYCGKTEELLRRLKRAKIGGQKVQLFKPSIDTRYGENLVVTHSSNELTKKIEELLSPFIYGKKISSLIISEINDNQEAIPINHSSSILTKLENDCKVVGIDELQFFDDGVIDVIKVLISKGIRVICSGLDMTSNGEPFGNVIPTIACIAKKVDKLNAVCSDCGEEAYISYKIEDNGKTIDIGSKGKYLALCEKCANLRNNKDA